MASIILECINCHLLFNTGYGVSDNSTLNLTSCTTICSHCGQTQNMPDGTFKEKVQGLIEYIQKQANPMAATKEIIEAIDEAKNNSNISSLENKSFYSALKPWLPTSIEKLAAYAALVGFIYTLISKEPTINNIEINQTFINQYNHSYMQLIIPPNIGRNDKCPCGSGKRYKHCHGALSFQP